MSVRRRLEDAHFLLAHGRADGALLSACAAISATSRKRYPKTTGMGDGAAFTKFLGEEIRVVTAGGVVNLFVRCPGADVKRYPDETMPLQDALYTFVRCQLAHEAEIAGNVEFLAGDAISVEVTADRLVLGGGLLPRLLIVPEYAPENADEFPLVAEMPPDVVGWMLFGKRRDNHSEYLEERQRRLTARSSSGPPSAASP
jgi:hypothetical protein